MRLEYNRVSLSKPDPDKFRTYEREQFRPRLKALLAEQNRLKEQIRLDSKIDWSKLAEEEQPAVELQLFGDKATLKQVETDATCPLLDELKAIKLDSLEDTKDVDPTEDFTGYTEVDGPSKLTVDSASKASVANLDCDETCYLYYDHGVNHFDGDFEHRFKTYNSSSNANSTVSLWVLANAIGDTYDLAVANESHLRLGWINENLYLREMDTAYNYNDSAYGSTADDTLYYCTIERDEATGTYGTIYCYICTGNYNGESGSSLVDTLSVTLHTSKKDYQYLISMASHDFASGGKSMSAYVEDLDLQEPQTYDLSLSDGISVGDSLSNSCVFPKALSDGVDFSEELHGYVDRFETVTDGITLSDSTSFNFAIPLTLSETINLADAIANKVVFNPSITDVADMSDTPSTKCIFKPSLSDGIEFSETLAGNITMQFSLSEIVDLNDSVAYVIKVTVSVSDGVTLGDTITSNILFHVIWQRPKYGVLPRLINRVIVLGQDDNGDPVYGESADDTINGEILEPISESMVTNSTDAASVAANVRAKARLSTDLGSILIIPNCGIETYDPTAITDSWGNQSAASFRVSGWSLDFQKEIVGVQEARYDMTVNLTAV
jgi:hypothetical protein